MTDRKTATRMVAVPYEPGQQLRRRLFSWTAVLITAVVMAVLGYLYGEFRTADLGERLSAQQALLESANQRALEAANRLVALEQERAIDQVAHQKSRESILQLQGQLQQMQKEIVFYKEIMAPSGTSTGLQIHELDLRQGRDTNQWDYRLVLTQLVDNQALIEGRVTLQLSGRLQDQVSTVTILPAPDGESGTSASFRFRYFQAIEGHFRLPEGFLPDRFLVTAEAKNRKATKIERVFEWQPGA